MTIPELLVTMLILLIILSVIFSFTRSSLSLYQTDAARNGALGTVRSTFDVLSADVQQAGERLNSDFPAISVSADSSGNAVLVLRRGLADGPLPLCAPIPDAGALYVNANNPFRQTLAGGVSNLPASCTDNLQNLASWDAALAAGGSVGLVIDMAGLTSDSLKVQSSATDPVSRSQTLQLAAGAGLPTTRYDPRKTGPADTGRDIRLYLLENRTYRVSGGQLTLAENFGAPQPAAPQVVAFTVTPYLKPPGALSADNPAVAASLPFPPSPNPAGLTWKDLAFLDIRLTVTDKSGQNTVTRTLNERMTPRNAGSADQ
ncbi:hypothetical protein [Deinococcus irradiatisoli]|uniref:hypothetical protein n=1 Tax=Deinococcus irradiatisoli TaxID=2202254 RepID=UPI0011B1C7A7|nr:hypothetical protein [Deinococcus irradiatisoli]